MLISGLESGTWRQRKDQGNRNVDELIDFVEPLEELVKDQVALIEKLSKSNRFGSSILLNRYSRKRNPNKGENRRYGPGLGRKLYDEKLKAVVRTETVWPGQFEKSECMFSHRRPIIRLEKHRPVLVACDDWVHKPTKTWGIIPVVIGRCGFGNRVHRLE